LDHILELLKKPSKDDQEIIVTPDIIDMCRVSDGAADPFH
jgi:hypothetical protein